MKCPTCGKPGPKTKDERSASAKRGLAKAKSAGHKIGRPELMSEIEQGRVFKAFQRGSSIRQLAFKFGVSRPCIDRIIRDWSWQERNVKSR